MEFFTIIGMWMLICIGVFVLAVVISFMIDESDIFEAFPVALSLIIVVFTFFMCAEYVTFTTNPEKFGYTKCVETEIQDEESEVQDATCN